MADDERSGKAQARPRLPSRRDVAAFRHDGAVCLAGALAGALAGEFIGLATAGVEQLLAAPSARASFADAARRGFFQDTDNWRRLPSLSAFVRSSPAAAIAAVLLGSGKINVLQDHVLVKEPGTAKATPWHQDQPYSPVDGADFITLWIPLDPVPLERALRFVAGSHRPGRWYRPHHFSTGSLREGDDPRWSPLPDLDTAATLSWATEPGDVVAFHGLTLHSAAGNLSPDARRRVLSLRWTGDDARFVRRGGPMSPEPPRDDPPAEGGPLDCPGLSRRLSALRRRPRRCARPLPRAT